MLPSTRTTWVPIGVPRATAGPADRESSRLMARFWALTRRCCRSAPGRATGSALTHRLPSWMYATLPRPAVESRNSEDAKQERNTNQRQRMAPAHGDRLPMQPSRQDAETAALLRRSRPPRRGLFAAADAELREDLRDVIARAVQADAEAVGDLLVGQALSQQLEDFLLSRREEVGVGWASASHR